MSVVALSLLVCLTACTNHRVLSAQEEIEIKTAVNQSFEGIIAASKAFDFDRYLEYFDVERFSGLNDDGTVSHSLREFEEKYRELFSIDGEYQSLKFTRVKVTVIDPETAVLVNEYEAEVLLSSGDIVSASGAGSQTWSKTTGTWRLVSVASSAPRPGANADAQTQR